MSEAVNAEDVINLLPAEESPDPKAERATAAKAIQDAKAAILQQAADDFDAKLAAALVDENAPMPTVADLDYFGTRRRMLTALVTRAEALVTTARNYQKAAGK